MRSFERLIATTIIWLAVASIAIALMVTQPEVNNTFLLVILLAAGFLSTTVVWGVSVALASQANDQAAERERRERRVVEKPKRSNQDPSAWINDLDQDQLAALESAITARIKHMDEDDQIELNRLLAEQDNARKGY